MFAVVDVETTGGYASGHHMTEISIVVHNGVEVVDDYTTLLNPGQSIPLQIQAMTGITPELVDEAPLFEEVAGKVHCGIDYNPKRLCSVRYARKIVPGLRSYSLKNLCKYFDVYNQATHRAWGDAQATAEILDQLLQRDKAGRWQHLIKKNQGEFNLPAHLPSEEYHSLPAKPGVYYFYDGVGKPLYIGKARNLKKRVASHFISGKATKRSQAFKREIHHIDYELTGSELVASLLEDHEIRHHWPRFNRAQKKPKKRFGVFAYQNYQDDWCLAVNKIQHQKGFLIDFYSHHQALTWVQKKVTEYGLNPLKCGFPAAYLPVDESEDHNEAFARMLAEEQEKDENVLIKTPGRQSGEEGFVYVENGKLKGIGFVPQEVTVTSADEAEGFMRELRNSITTRAIVQKAMEKSSYPVWVLGESREAKSVVSS